MKHPAEMTLEELVKTLPETAPAHSQYICLKGRANIGQRLANELEEEKKRYSRLAEQFGMVREEDKEDILRLRRLAEWSIGITAVVIITAISIYRSLPEGCV